jgi:CRISPR type III-A-associated RAMP protein Csm4
MSAVTPTTSFTVRFRPLGPWRFGPDSGARDRVDLIYHSDAVFSAVCSAMRQLGMAEEWFEATARSVATPAVRISSFYPFQGKTLLVVPPRNIWPPADSTKVRYKGARFVPLPVVESLLADRTIDENRWAVDGESECLIPHDSGRGPFRVAIRSSASVDRLETGRVESHSTACLEFARDAGLWTVVQFADASAAGKWQGSVRSAFALLADSGFGGERSRGWGRSETPEWTAWNSAVGKPLPDGRGSEEDGRGSEDNGRGGEVAQDEALVPEPVPAATTDRAYWLLSLYLPGTEDSVDWKRGSYSTITRRGRIESSAHWGEAKNATLMVSEGSVLVADGELNGAAHNIAPEGFSHPVYRAGFAVAIPIPWRVAA